MVLTELLPAAAGRHPSLPAVTRGARSVTYSELHRAAGRLARALVDRGIRPGDRIGMLGYPSLELVTLAHAAVAIGALPVGMFPDNVARGATREIQRIADDAGFAAFAFDDDHAPIARELAHARSPLLLPVAAIAALIEQHAPLDTWHRPAHDDIALVAYTGGTTGRPKGVMHSHRGVAAWMGMAPATEPGGRSLLSNIAHLSGISTLWAAAASGACLVLPERYPATPEDIVELIDRAQITTLGVVSGTLRTLLAVPALAGRSVDTVKCVIVGGAFASAQLLQRTARAFPAALVANSYSLTESGQTISMLPLRLAHGPETLHSVGRPAGTRIFNQVPFDVRILDGDGGEVPRGEIGEIVVRGEQLMLGYWNDPAETARALRDGWLYTGDLGRLDAAGFLYVVDRVKDMVVASDGTCVYSFEVEAFLERHPAIADIAVVAARDADAGERVAAFAVLRDGATLTLAEL